MYTVHLESMTIRESHQLKNNHACYLQDVESVAEPVEESKQKIQGHVMDECGTKENMETKGKRVSLCSFVNIITRN